MKKAIALLLVLSLCVMAFAGCQQTTAPAATEAEPAAEEPAAEEPAAEEPAAEEPAAEGEFVWNGQMEVWSILPTTGAEGLIVINDSMAETMKAEGFTHVYKDAAGDPTAQVTFVEDAIAAGNVGALMIAAMDTVMLEDVVKEATAAGIAVAMLGVSPDYPIAGYVATAYELTGMYAVKAAEDWAAQYVAAGGAIPTGADGKYEIAVDTYYDITDGVYRSKAIVGTVAESEVFTQVSETSAYGQNGYSDAYDNATDVLSAHPDCRVFIAYEPEQAMGIADAVKDYAELNSLDLAGFCVIPCYNQDSTFKTDYYAVALADPSANAVKGYATYGDDTGKGTGVCLAKILLGVCGVGDYTWNFGEAFFDDVGAANVYGFTLAWKQGDENPAAKYRVAD